MTLPPEPTAIALIPARSGSKRVPEKNVQPLAGHPLLGYAIAAARGSSIFSRIVVSTDSPTIANVAADYGAEVPFLRPEKMAADLSPDIEWVAYTLGELEARGEEYDCFSILRPTSPFRTAETIRRAWKEFLSARGADSLRAVERCRHHPGKMWVVRGNRMVPLLPFGPQDRPWHSTPYQALPEVYVQNASLEIAWSRVVFEDGNISGSVVVPFFTRGYEGFDINDGEDFLLAEELIRRGAAKPPEISISPAGYRDGR
jgi:N-acylneuraminate cytidylyltransferase